MNAVVSVYRSRELLWNFTLRELRTKYRRSVLGWAWSMLNPLAVFAVYWFVFGQVFDAPAPLGDPSGLDNFALFLICGLVPWNFFNLITSTGLGAISANAGLVRRVAFPREILVFANVAHAGVQFLIEMTLLCVILAIAGSPLLPWIPLALLNGVFLAMFGTGFALALSALSIYLRDIPYLWTLALQVWFFATPIVYAPEFLEDKIPGWSETLLKAQPMAAFVRVNRQLLYDGGPPGPVTFVGAALVGVVVLALGWVIFRKLSVRFAEEV